MKGGKGVNNYPSLRPFSRSNAESISPSLTPFLQSSSIYWRCSAIGIRFRYPLEAVRKIYIPTIVRTCD